MHRVRAVFTGVAGTPWYSNFYFTQEGGTATQAQTAAVNFWYGLRVHQSEAIRCTVEQEVPLIDEVSGDVVGMGIGLTDQTWLCTDGGERLPAATQALLRTFTGVYLGGRQIRGRVFVPGLVEDDSLSGLPGEELTTDIAAAAATLIGESSAQWVVYSKSNGSYAVVNGASVWSQFAVLRSRRD